MQNSWLTSTWIVLAQEEKLLKVDYKKKKKKEDGFLTIPIWKDIPVIIILVSATIVLIIKPEYNHIVWNNVDRKSVV